MIKLQEVFKHQNPNINSRYGIREIFVNPDHIAYIRPNHDAAINESISSSGHFCSLLLNDERIVVVGSVAELRDKIFKGKGLIHG
jgi:predicted nucleotidyltransferase